MNSVTTELKLNVNRKEPTQRIFAKQFDRNARVLKISLYDGSIPYPLENIGRACIRGSKPDNNQFFNDCEIDGDNIIATLSEQILASNGTVMTDIVLFAAGENSPILSSEVFYIDVFPSYFDDKQAESDSEYSAVIDALSKAPNKEGIWRGFADYFNSLENIPEEAIEEFDSVNLEIMTLDCIIKKIFIINKIITDSQPKGVSDYSELNNKPSINGVTLDGNKTSQELGIVIPNNSGDDKNYIHTQSQSSNTWVIAHNLGKYPSVTVINSAGDEVVGDVKYDSQNQVTVTFKGAFKGTAILN